MSVSNVILSDRRVAIVSDTVTYLDKAPLRFTHKTRAFPRSRFAVSTRGACRIGDGFEALLATADSFAQAVAWTLDAVPAMNEAAADPRLMSYGYEVTLIGIADDAPTATRITYRATADEVERLDLLPGVYMAPSLGHHQIPVDLSDDQIVRLAHAQQAIVVKHGLMMCVGGDVELTTVTLEGVEQRVLAEYPDKAMTLARIAAGDAGRVELAAA